MKDILLIKVTGGYTDKEKDQIEKMFMSRFNEDYIVTIIFIIGHNDLNMEIITKRGWLYSFFKRLKLKLK